MLLKHAALDGCSRQHMILCQAPHGKDSEQEICQGSRTWAGAPILLAAVEQHVGAARAICGVHGLQGRHARVVEAVPALALILSCRGVVPTSQRAVVLADGEQVIYWRHLLQDTGSVNILLAIACQACRYCISAHSFVTAAAQRA